MILLTNVEQAKDKMAQNMGDMLSRLYNEQATQALAIKESYERDKARIVEQQRAEHQRLQVEHHQRQLSEQAERQALFRRGMLGLWDRITGQHKRLAEQNRLRAEAALNRDKQERDKITFEQLEQRRSIQMDAQTRHGDIKRQASELKQDKERFMAMRSKTEPETQQPERTQKIQQPQPPTSPLFNDRQREKRKFTKERKKDDDRHPSRDDPALDR